VLLAVAAAFVIGRVASGCAVRISRSPTIAFTEVLRHAVKNLHDITGGDVGVRPPPLFRDQPEPVVLRVGGRAHRSRVRDHRA